MKTADTFLQVLVFNVFLLHFIDFFLQSKFPLKMVNVKHFSEVFNREIKYSKFKFFQSFNIIQDNKAFKAFAHKLFFYISQKSWRKYVMT